MKGGLIFFSIIFVQFNLLNRRCFFIFFEKLRRSDGSLFNNYFIKSWETSENLVQKTKDSLQIINFFVSLSLEPYKGGKFDIIS